VVFVFLAPLRLRAARGAQQAGHGARQGQGDRRLLPRRRLQSKTYCPFCARVKRLLAELAASYKAVELDVESDGSELQSALADWTGQRTVPCVFIKGKHIGGCDDTMAMHKGGNLVPLLTEAGAIATPSL
ncbi:Os02g0618100, partial [Oryza sativa Japonica Group]